MPVSLIILAAGQGTRMNSDLPKVLHPLAGAPLLHHAMRTGAMLEPVKTIIVTGHGREMVAKSARNYDETCLIVTQEQQLGTGHAVAQAIPHLDETGDSVILYGDTPFIKPQTLDAICAARGHHDIVMLGFHAKDPGRYGRFVTKGDDLLRIVEFKDATDDERAITLCNSGIVCVSNKVLAQLIAQLDSNNAAGEYYLTDIVALARRQGLSAGFVTCPEMETMGINSRPELAVAEAVFQAEARAEALENGITMQAPETVFFAFDTIIGRDCVLEPNIIFGPNVTVESGAQIKGFCHLEGCHISRGAVVGPFARLRPGAELAEDVHVGNFVEIKNAVLDEGVKVGHLTYLGDADIGAHTNIGAGTITCNYDGVNKHRTHIGKDVFVGSNTMLVAPVTVGAGAMTGSGSVITQDVPADALAIGRARQATKTGLAPRMKEKFREFKNLNQKDKA